MVYTYVSDVVGTMDGVKMKKIIIINNGLSGGGTERASVSFAHYLLNNGYDVTILALYKSEHFYQLDKRIHFIEPDFSRDNLSTLAYTAKMILYVRHQVRLIEPKTVLAYNEWTNAYVLLSCLGLGYPIFVSERMHPKAKLPFLTEILRKWLYPNANGIVTQTKFGENVLKSKIRKGNFITIPNPVNVVEPIPVAKKKQIIAVGRLEYVKGHKYLIEAFAKVRNKNWNLCIIGDGSQMKELKDLAKSLNVATRIEFKGHQLDFRKDLSESEIYVLPSIKEGFPNSLIEAMSLPMACISGDYYEGEHDLVIHEYNGLLFKTQDSYELANAINRLIEDEDLRFRLAENAKNVRSDLAFDVVAKKLKEFIINE